MPERNGEYVDGYSLRLRRKRIIQIAVIGVIALVTAALVVWAVLG